MQNSNHGNIHAKPTRKVGFVLKPHGFQGAVKIELDQTFTPKGFLLIQYNEKYVPFPIENFQTASGIVKLKFANSESEALDLCGRDILDFLENLEKENISDEFFDPAGYTLIDQESKMEYRITSKLNLPGHELLEFRAGNKDCLLPFNPDIIVKIDHKNQTIFALFPEGILDV